MQAKETAVLEHWWEL